MTTNEHEDGGRDPLFNSLRRSYQEMDPVPVGLADRVLIALALDDIDLEYELLTMIHRSEQLTGVRSGNDQKTVLEFTASGITVLLRISPIDATHRRIDGWVTPAQQLTAALWQDKGTSETTIGAHGRFEFDFVPRGLTRLDLLQPAERQLARTTAFRTTLFEI